VSAMGNSDTHKLSTSLAGYPRNFIPVADDHADKVVVPDVIDAIRKKRSFLTTAPFVEINASGRGQGDLVAADHGHVVVHVKVRAASWVRLGTLLLYVGGKVVESRALDPGPNIVRFDGDVEIDASTDTYVVARVEGSDPLPPVAGDGAKLVAFPLAVTNPIWIDGDGDGKFDSSKITSLRPK
jgi:hypothetical protein